jgi:hypothetical protein
MAALGSVGLATLDSLVARAPSAVALKRHLRNRLTKMTILDDKLRVRKGPSEQDHAHHPDLARAGCDGASARRPKIFGVGDLSIETAGEASRETIVNIDRPQEVADHINEHSQKGHSTDPLS